MTNISVRVEPQDRNINIQCHAVNQEVAVTKVESHTVSVLYPPEQPKITGYTEGEVLKGGTMRRVMCTCAGGNPLATIKWYVAGEEMPSTYSTGENYATATLDLAVNMTDNGAMYKCVASSKVMAEPMEQSVRMMVQFAPTFVSIKVQPKTLRMGEKATLSCESGEAYPPARLVWLLRGEVLSAGKESFRKGNYGGKTTSSRLNVRVKSRDDGDVYTCRAVNEIGEALDAVTLEIACKSQMMLSLIPWLNTFSDGACNQIIFSVPDKPEFPVLSSPVEVMEGEPFVLNVTASGSPSQLDYTWEKDGQQRIGSDSNEIWFSGGFLHLERVSREHAGTYTVAANNSEGRAVATVKLDVLFSPKYTKID